MFRKLPVASRSAVEFLSIFLVAFLEYVSGESIGKPCGHKLLFKEEANARPMHRVCYFTTWARYRPPPFNMQPVNVDPRLCSHMVIAFVWITDGRLTLHSEWEDQTIVHQLNNLRVNFPNLKVMGAVGGWNFGSEPFRLVVSTKKNRQLFVRSAVEFLRKWNLDGLDLDWEYPDWKERRNFTLLIKNLREAFNKYEYISAAGKKQPFLLTAAVPAAQTRLGGYNIPIIKDLFDFVNVMAYDLHGPWDPQTGHNAPLRSHDGLNVAAGIEMWLERGMPRRKLVLGLPTYGHSFRLAKPWVSRPGAHSLGGIPGKYTRSDGFFAYYEVCELLADPETHLHWDRQAGIVPYAVNNDTWVSFDNEISLTKKVEWALDKGLGGVMIWSLALDDFSGSVCQDNVTFPLLRAVNHALGCEFNSGSEYEKFIARLKAAKSSRKLTTRPKTRPNVNAGSSVLKPGSECEGDHLPRAGKNCSHFIRCDRGKLHGFVCPPGLAFSPESMICLWPWEVPGCEDKIPPIVMPPRVEKAWITTTARSAQDVILELR